jgi:hypothetical protein
MSKLILGTSMIFTGLLGLSATACGIFFLFVLPGSAYGLVLGVTPGALMLWMTVVLWKDFRSAPPAEQAPQSPPDRNGNP